MPKRVNIYEEFTKNGIHEGCNVKVFYDGRTITGKVERMNAEKGLVFIAGNTLFGTAENLKIVEI